MLVKPSREESWERKVRDYLTSWLSANADTTTTSDATVPPLFPRATCGDTMETVPPLAAGGDAFTGIQDAHDPTAGLVLLNARREDLPGTSRRLSTQIEWFRQQKS